MKKPKIFNFLGLALAGMLLSTSVNAATITVHYNNSDANRLPTYTYINNYMSNRFTVNGYNNGGNGSAESQLKNSKAFVAHHHGAPGRQYLNQMSNGISASYNGGGWKSINSMATDLSKPLYIAIYYGCETGVTDSTYGSITAVTTTKLAKSAVAWKISTYVYDVNVWNRYFFDKARTTSASASTALTYADTKLAADSGSYQAAAMKNQRTTSGSFTWTFAQMGSILNSLSTNNFDLSKSKQMVSYDNTIKNVMKIDTMKTTADKELGVFIDQNNNEYIYDGNELVAYINMNNNPNQNVTASYTNSQINNLTKINNEKTVKLLKDILINGDVNLEDYKLIESSYVKETDEYTYLYGKTIDGYNTNDAILVSVNSNGELVSYSATQLGVYDKYNDIKIDKEKVADFVNNEMESVDDVTYSIDREFINIVDGKPVLQIGIRMVHENEAISTKELYYPLA